jgi:hypothetical protein
MSKIWALCALLTAGLWSASCGSLNHAPGQSCSGDGDCMAGLKCATEDVNGQCIKTCTPSMDATCGDPTLACSYEGHCYTKCNMTSNCVRASEGYVCKDDTPARGVKFCDSP